MSASKPSMSNLVLVNRVLANEQGRDKFNKVIQYGSKLVAFYLLTADPKSEYGAKFNKMFAFTRDCRKILRLLKWASEVERQRSCLLRRIRHSSRSESLQRVECFAIGSSTSQFFAQSPIASLQQFEWY